MRSSLVACTEAAVLVAAALAMTRICSSRSRRMRAPGVSPFCGVVRRGDGRGVGPALARPVLGQGQQLLARHLDVVAAERVVADALAVGLLDAHPRVVGLGLDLVAELGAGELAVAQLLDDVQAG